MKKIFPLFLFLCFIISSKSFAQTDLNLSSVASFDAEPTLAVNPSNTNNIVCAWMGTSGLRVSIKVKASHDGGVTWGTVGVMPHLNSTTSSADPTLAFDGSGNCFLSYVDFTQTGSPAGVIYSAKSTDGGDTWSVPNVAINQSEDATLPIDRPWIAIDRGTAHTGRIYLCTMGANWIPTPRHVFLKYSDDAGVTWSSLKIVDTLPWGIPDGVVSMGVPGVDKSGRLYIAYLGMNPAYSTTLPIMIVATTDSNASNLTLTYRYAGVYVGVADTTIQQGWALAADPSHSGRMILAWTQKPFTSATVQIYKNYTENGGITWGSPQKVNDDAGDSTTQDMVWCSWATGSKPIIAWRDHRRFTSSTTSPFDIYASVSFDHGQSFEANYRVNSDTCDYAILTKGNDFIGIGQAGTKTVAVWGDHRTGDWEVFFNRTSTPLGAEEIESAAPEFSVIYDEQFNPFLKLRQAEKSDYEVFDLLGRKVASEKLTGEKLIALPQPDPGIYFVRMKSEVVKYLVITSKPD